MHLKSLILIAFLALFNYANCACNTAWGQCGGDTYRGEKCCVSGYYCKYYNQWFSQCIPGNTTTTSRVRTNESTTQVVTKTTTVVNPTTAAPQPTNNTPKPNTLFIAGDSTGDSTTANGGKTVGWGKFLSNYVTCNVQNHAKSGRSARTFWREGRWTTLMNGVQAGDYVFIQFGHNDGGGPYHEKERGCVDGTGNESVTVTLKSGEKEVVHTFPWYIRQMANQVLAKKAHPILLTQTPRKIFTNGKIETPGRFHDYMIMVAKELNIPCINMFKYIARQYESLGEAYLNNNGWFPVDYLHPSPTAADFDAKLLVNAFSKCQPISELIAVLNDKGKAVNYDCRQ
ncbi:SGNH hydrolase [Anaeromyces robustus]|jgi:rhamnogalacturonan acetylesterase|uniref:SGNH hydrolase n=1 Tax=Anaeromyces robustus TaxID=1754192 RepID=A0A1Y1XLQ3_9FUNG|nr:SGNH hydrolase [Anaeromyces robustus]|eukprot:ORX86679.1 SGNH hydrolase [Anaeromyces robustus]